MEDVAGAIRRSRPPPVPAREHHEGGQGSEGEKPPAGPLRSATAPDGPPHAGQENGTVNQEAARGADQETEEPAPEGRVPHGDALLARHAFAQSIGPSGEGPTPVVKIEGQEPDGGEGAARRITERRAPPARTPEVDHSGEGAQGQVLATPDGEAS